MPSLRIYYLFLSHAWEYNADYYRIVNLLNGAKNFQWHNYSVPEHDPLYAGNRSLLVNALRNQIRPTHVTIILVGMYVPYRYWIQKEIEIAQEMNKKILGVALLGGQRIPTAVSEAAHEIVGWRTQSIVDAIRRLS